ncbi:SDR family NAD(P)-dependent oxidoreductase [Streptomyces sp. NPDC017979]|uniref:SDR family NAD(P)-dependent oxidoreductase n=1 Tax=Streptomyces sp. NPDC017979 TaxID=3365024 RepID=UPI0037AA4858
MTSRTAAVTPRTALVTGAARGIGHDVARRLLAEGWRVVLTDVHADVARVADALGGERALGLVADAASPADAAAVVDAALGAFGRIDAFVANAAVGGPETPLLDTPDAEIQHVLDVNFFGVLHGVRAVRSALARSDRPRIVVIGSLFAQQPTPGAGAYSAAKAAVGSLMRTLSVELAEEVPGLTVNAVAPGYVMTEMHRDELRSRARRTGRTFDEERARVVAQVPLGRHGTGADVADAVHHLLSGAAYVTGQTVNVNGGVLTS